MIEDLKNFGILLGIAAAVYMVSFLIIRMVSAAIQKLTGASPGLARKKLGSAIRSLMAVIALNVAERYSKFQTFDTYVIEKIIFLLLIASIAMLLIKLSAFIRDLLYERFDMQDRNNLNNRKLRTQI